MAHTIVLSEYSIEYVDGQWELSFDQKTSQLRDAIYSVRADLRGINLNSEVFQEATANYITSNVLLTYKGKSLGIVPQHMHYGGLRFESRFLVKGLPSNPDFLTIRVNGFDEHEHSIVLFRMTENAEGYLNYFNQEQRLATYDFAAKTFVFEEVKPKARYEIIFYTILTLVVLGVIARLIQIRKILAA